MKNIVVLFGGKSCEHDISIITAMQVLGVIREDKYNILPIYITKENKWFLVRNLRLPCEFENFDEKKYTQVVVKIGEKNLYKFSHNKLKVIDEIDCALICCHGLNGEDGTLQGVMELCGIPYTSSGVTSSALSMDKVFMKQIFESLNLPICKYVWFSKSEYIENCEKLMKKIKKELEFPLIVKPANLGSSIGISKCENDKDLEKAIEVALHYDKKIIVEEVVQNLREINCAVLGNRNKIIVSNLDEPKVWSDFFDFNQKYLVGDAKEHKQSAVKLPKYINLQIKKMSTYIFKNFDCSGIVRIDYLYNNETEEIFVGEINSIPGSLSNFMFNMPFSELIDNLIEFAIQKNNEEIEHIFSYKSTVLKKSFCVKK